MAFEKICTASDTQATEDPANDASSASLSTSAHRRIQELLVAYGLCASPIRAVEFDTVNEKPPAGF
jgi:hypothetical protein